MPQDIGVDYVMVLWPSSRRQENIHRTFAFDGFVPHFPKKQDHPVGGLAFLEQDTGVEPAFTAWEAVVLPIYESCMWDIIAELAGKFNHFLSMDFDWMQLLQTS